VKNNSKNVVGYLMQTGVEIKIIPGLLLDMYLKSGVLQLAGQVKNRHAYIGVSTSFQLPGQ
jgi:hypothetical protein